MGEEEEREPQEKTFEIIMATTSSIKHILCGINMIEWKVYTNK